MPRDITVTFDDGSTHVYRGAPDDLTPDQVQARASKDFGKTVTALDGGRKPTLADQVKQQLGNVAAGAIRGAGSIGATILAPVDVASDLMAGKGLSLASNRDRRAAMDAALSDLGADTKSTGYAVGKLGSEIAGTLGVGGVAGNALARIAPQATNLANAVRTAGMSGGSMPVRMAGGAVTGAASAGLVNPEDVGMGAVVGAAAPAVFKAAGVTGHALGRMVRGPDQSPDMLNAIQAARQSGYVIPPTQAKPSFANRVIEGVSGKITTAQNASAKNQAVTNAKAAQALGLPADTKLTPDVLTNVRNAAGAAYDALGNVGTITPGPTYTAALDALQSQAKTAAAGFPNAKASPVIDLVDSLRSSQFDASSAIAKIKELRAGADDAFRTGNTDVGRASRGAAKALEDALEDHLQKSGQTQLLQEFRDARQLIAKTYSVEKALNPTTGSVDARQLAGQLKKGKPLSGDLRQAADFAARFPKAAQPVEGMGSLPQFSPLDVSLAALLTTGTGPAGIASMAARPLMRSAALSPYVQNRLAQQSPSAIRALLARPDAAQIGYRVAPVLAADR